MKALFLGYGKMGSALGEAWLNAGLVDSLVAVAPGQPQGLRAQVVDSAAKATGRFDLVVVAVKPAMAAGVIASLPAEALQGATLVSVMAGVSCTTLAAASPEGTPVVRAMPNTPVMLGAGCTGLFASDLNDNLRQLLSRLFEAVGVAFWVEHEELLHAITALSGSGPAYYHLFSEALADAGIALGLPEVLARQLAANTALGAARLQCQPDADFKALRTAVTSPNGTTAAAIEHFEADASLRRLVKDAATAAFDRSVELGKIE